MPIDTNRLTQEGQWVLAALSPGGAACGLCGGRVSMDPQETTVVVHIHPDGNHMAFPGHIACVHARMEMRLAQLN